MPEPYGFIQGLFTGPTGPVTLRQSTHWNFGRTPSEVVRGKDDEDLIDKTAALLRTTFGLGTFFALVDIITVNNKGGYLNALQRMKYHYTPWIGCSLVYTTTVNFVSGIRGGKTDCTNHLVAGFASGAFLGKITRSTITGFGCGALFAFIGGMYKRAELNGYVLMPDMDFARLGGDPFSHKRDHTTNLFTPRPNYWARSEEDIPRVVAQGQLGDGNPNRRLW